MPAESVKTKHPFLIGVGRAIDISGSNYYFFIRHISSQLDYDPDAMALANDWELTGKDILSACKQYSQENNLTPPQELPCGYSWATAE
ncbi:MAG: hypothetical protein HY747_11280 [Elusimicrobia bacterium]|nr:hypothetical protein [Elusimicrobiota bacterium]